MARRLRQRNRKRTCGRALRRRKRRHVQATKVRHRSSRRRLAGWRSSWRSGTSGVVRLRGSVGGPRPISDARASTRGRQLAEPMLLAPSARPAASPTSPWATARGHRAEPAELAKPIQIGETVHTRHRPRGSGPAPPDACVPPPAPTAKTAVVPQTRSPAPLITPTPGSARGCVECTAAAEGRSRENPTPGGRPGHPAPLSIHTNTLTEREQ